MTDISTSDEPRGRFTDPGPIAIIDIGSNSVRLVIYERLARNPTALFNEKILAGLGRGVGATGRLGDENVDTAQRALVRFRRVCDHVGVTELHILATAAAREAENGPAFIAKVESICRAKVQILSGRDEAFYSAMGVFSGFWRADGLVGDLGGGSLELVDISAHGIGDGRTFPLGGIRLQESSDKDLALANEIAREELDKADWLGKAKNRDFYAIGGTWRSLGRLHLFQQGYPLHVMHDYTVPAEVMIEFCEQIIRDDLSNEPCIQVISKARRALLPYGAAVMRQTLLHCEADKVVFSALGVREGYLYDLLDEEGKKQDPLITAAHELGVLRSRDPSYSAEVVEWSEQAMRVAGVDESEGERRLRVAACQLTDIGWRAHPDYRGQQSLNIVSNGGFVGIDHAGRAYLALTVFYRYEGIMDDALSPSIRSLCNTRLMKLARILGATLRVAALISASMNGVLLKSKLSLVNGKLVLALPAELADMQGDRLTKRLNQLGRVMDLEAEVRVL
ncbi:Guanosine-5'-triphosphate,3'-diphosphate pyrophosphatase [Pseudovibrio axinellae]|uniref:Guanosine-5'-triphosphate,3'-diphosphate pyrophosphatase n=1 Tax=Pseudovibrio axinellae TaxID=989403 RepID=A0A165ULT1_9HYPH|nr:Ppx/GppA phosphatase family protein [Pseudovibrio axinellae]KZL12526.1 Guanosine-5'-triphosphate,3'-diphosphate pyrophosphatase [Pseudovibrio axinellae]SEP68462.1 exopolyphosphatase / guanosine-5'-triphosphate,3'-diphosphate pyrophosphatase [Pseudovibrio axinellae]